MNASVIATPPVSAPPTTSVPSVLEALPDMPLRGHSCPRRARQQIDLLLLAIEALDLGGSEAILLVAQELELKPILKNRVYLWQLRSTNPLRRYTQRIPLSQPEAKALVTIACNLARRLTVPVRELLLAHQKLEEKGLSVQHHFRLADYLERFRAHFRSRMNPKRSAVLVYSEEDKLNELALGVLRQLLFCTGTAGAQRFWVSLFDGEI
ncbi:MAG: DUF3038 domain-containing protein [Prochlorotrichaceae cyanobacterium]|jgi:hypothetical protein